MGKKKHISLRMKRAIGGYLFITPFILGFLIFMLKPLIQSFYISLCSVELGPKGANYTLCGFDNYKAIFLKDVDYVRMLLGEVSSMGVQVISILVLSLFIALILNQKFHGRIMVRVIFMLPIVLSSGVILTAEQGNDLMNSFVAIEEVVEDEDAEERLSITDTIESMTETLGIGSELFDTVIKIVEKIYDVVMASGIQIIIFLSILQTIPSSIYEAASMEGCTEWEKLWKITFPMISPVLLVNVIYTIVDYFMSENNQILNYVDRTTYYQMNFGLGSAMAWMYFVVTALFILLSYFIIHKGVYHYE